MIYGGSGRHTAHFKRYYVNTRLISCASNPPSPQPLYSHITFPSLILGIKQFYVAVDKEDWKLETLCDLYETLTITQVYTSPPGVVPRRWRCFGWGTELLSCYSASALQRFYCYPLTCTVGAVSKHLPAACSKGTLASCTCWTLLRRFGFELF